MLYFVPDFFLDLNMLKNDPLFFFFSSFAADMSAGADVVRAGADCLASGGTSGESVSYTHLTLPTIYSV